MGDQKTFSDKWEQAGNLSMTGGGGGGALSVRDKLRKAAQARSFGKVG